MDFDEQMMHRAIELAQNARGRTSPNPLVGAVIVRNGKIVAEGWHRKAGTPHAEIHALNMAGDLAQGATIYVSLEPCAHYGRTGPCAKALVEAGISRVVVAMTDPNPKVAGKGLDILREAGIEVITGVLEQEARAINEPFIKWITTGMPYVALKTAMSLDGKITTAGGESRWISNELSRNMTHELRDEYDGIMVGINTVLADNPSLTTRLAGRQGKNPVRIVVDSQGRIPLDSKLLTDGAAPVIVAVSGTASRDRIKALEQAGAKVLVCGQGERTDLKEMLRQLGELQITSILTEGGGTLNFSLLEAGLADRLYAFIAPKLLGGRTAITPVEGEGFVHLQDAAELTDIEIKKLAEDVLITGKIKR